MPRGRTEFPLSIVLRTVDRATTSLRRINARLRGLTAPVRRINNQFRAMARSAGLPKLVAGLRGVGKAARGVAKAVGGIAIAAGLGIAGLKSLIGAGDQLAKQADRLGLTVDAYAQLRFAASQSGVEMARFDSAMEGFSKRVGEAKAGTGSLTTFLNRASPALLTQVKAAKSNEEAFDLMVVAMGKIEDPSKRAALASAAFGRSGQALLNLFAAGPDGVDALKKEYFELAGSQEESARKSEKVQDALGRISAAMGGVKASILTGLAPAFLELADKLKAFLVENRAAIAAWARDFGQKLPGRIKKLINGLKALGKAIKPVRDAIGGMRGAAIALAGILGGKLLLAVVALGKAMLATPIGLLITGIAGLIYAGKQLYDNWHLVKDFFAELWAKVQARFGRFLSFVKFGFLNFTPMGLVIKHWGPIKDFFGALWDGITGVFRKAWKVIKTIVDKIVGAAKKVIDAATTVGRFLADPAGSDIDKVGGPTRGSIVGRQLRRQARKLDIIPPRRAATSPQPVQKSESRIKLDISGAPRGARAEVDPRSDADVDLTLGFQMGGAL